MATQFTVTIRNNRLTQVKTAADAGGSGTAKIKIYGGVAAPGITVSPTTTPAGATLLATLTGVTLGTPASGAMTVTATAQNAVASGTPTFIRITDSSDNTIAEIDAAVGSGSANFSAAITSGGQVSMSSGQFSEGNS